MIIGWVILFEVSNVIKIIILLLLLYNIQMFDVVNITGFQAFGNVEVNPTQLIINQLQKNPPAPLRRIKKLNVTVKEVDYYTDYLSMSCKPKQGKTLNLHLGVGGGKVYQLQSCGYNNKDFSIPDNDGYKCSRQKINHKMELDQPLQTKLDLKKLSKDLQAIGHKCEISTDPGRYLCNYIYFCSLQKICGEHCTSLFVHFPSLKIKKHEQNLKFVIDLINLLTKK